MICNVIIVIFFPHFHVTTFISPDKLYIYIYIAYKLMGRYSMGGGGARVVWWSKFDFEILEKVSCMVNQSALSSAFLLIPTCKSQPVSFFYSYFHIQSLFLLYNHNHTSTSWLDYLYIRKLALKQFYVHICYLTRVELN